MGPKLSVGSSHCTHTLIHVPILPRQSPGVSPRTHLSHRHIHKTYCTAHAQVPALSLHTIHLTLSNPAIPAAFLSFFFYLLSLFILSPVTIAELKRAEKSKETRLVVSTPQLVHQRLHIPREVFFLLLPRAALPALDALDICNVFFLSDIACAAPY